MPVKTIDMVRKIRDNNYITTKDLPIEEQVRIIKEKAKKLQEEIEKKKVKH